MYIVSHHIENVEWFLKTDFIFSNLDDIKEIPFLTVLKNG